MSLQPAVIVVGAGRGSRFAGSSHKLLQNLGASTVFGATLRHAVASELQVVVVTTEPLADTARLNVAARDVVVLPPMTGGMASDGAELGMGYSIGAGVRHCPAAGGWLVLPADMPLVLPTTLRSVARELADHADHAVVYAQHLGRRGHPVGFSPALYSELIALSADEGARRLTARHPAFGLAVDDPGVLIDVDTQADLDRIRQRFAP